MFYEEKPEKALRLGDIVKGFLVSAPCIESPIREYWPKECKIELEKPDFAVILSPCCSIGDGTLTLSPLISVIPGFFRNPYLAYSLTNVNRPMTPKQSVPPYVWLKLPQEEKNRRLAMDRPKSYAFVEYFVYEAHDLLPTYSVHRKEGPIETGCYMIDFRRMYPVECSKIKSAKEAPLETKVLQLTIEARAELRQKLSNYFMRIPQEDHV